MPFEIFQSQRTERYYFRLKQGNGQTILSSESYTSLAGAENGAVSVTKNSHLEERYERKEGISAGRKVFYFLLKAKNGATIGKSDTYATMTGRENAICNVKKYGTSEAEVKIL